VFRPWCYRNCKGFTSSSSEAKLLVTADVDNDTVTRECCVASVLKQSVPLGVCTDLNLLCSEEECVSLRVADASLKTRVSPTLET